MTQASYHPGVPAPAVTRVEADEMHLMGARLRERRDKLGHSVADLGRHTGTAASYIHDCESGRKFPSRAFVTKLADLTPADPSLVPDYENLYRQRDWRRRRPASLLAERVFEELSSGFPKDFPVPAPVGQVGDSRFARAKHYEECVDLAIGLVMVAAKRGTVTQPAPSPPTIYINAPSFERSAPLEWDAAVRCALERGWRVVHLLHGGTDDQDHIQQFLRVLPFVGFSGEYRPIGLAVDASDPGTPVIEFIVATDVGCLQLYPGTSRAEMSGVSFASSDKEVGGTVCEVVALHAEALEASGTQLLKVYEARSNTGMEDSAVQSLKAKVAFDVALTDADARPGKRVLVKSGLMVATMPPQISQEQILRWMAAVKDGSPEYVEAIRTLARDRTRRWNALRNNKTHISRDICSKRAIWKYLTADDLPLNPSPDEKFLEYVYEREPLYSGRGLTKRERQQHVTSLEALVRSRTNRYELGLAGEGDIPIVVGDTYFVTYETGVFLVTPRRRPNEGPTAMFCSIQDRVIIDAFFELFDGIWERLPDEATDQESVADWLHRAVWASLTNDPMPQ